MINENKLGRFEVRRQLGRGGIGDVSLAYDPLNKREVALKVIDTSIADREMLEAEKQGARLQEQLSRDVPQIARVYEIDQTGEHFYIAMEYVQGTDLSEFLLRGPFPGPRALSCAIQLCEILDRVFLSEEGRRDRVVHGDIKPQNIRIEPEDKVRLLDFGVAKRVSPTRQYTGNVFGSLPYLSPERLAERKVSIQSDLWSVAVVLYQMLTGELPYQGDTDEEMKEKILRGGLPQPVSPRLHAKLRPVLARCLEVNPSARFASAADLKAELEDFLQSGALEAEAVSQKTRRTVDPLPWREEAASVETAGQPSVGRGPAGVPLRKERRLWWARLAAEAYSELRQFHEQLRRLELTVPSRARGFRDNAADRDREVERALSNRWRWPKKESRELLRDRVLRLWDVSEPLSAAIREAEQIEKELHVLDRGVTAIPDPQTRSWLTDRSKRWFTELRQIGAAAYRPMDLQDDQDRVRKLRDGVLLHAQVLSRLEEAEWVLSILGSTAQTAPLSAALPDLHDQLRKQGPTDDWLKRIQILVQPLRDAARKARNPLQELEKLLPVLVDLRSWSQELQASQPEVEQLDQRYHALKSGAKLADVDALAQDCEALRQQFLLMAGGLRDHKINELEARVKLLASVCGPQPDLEERVRGLKRMRLEEPRAVPDWTSRFQELDEHFRSVLAAQESALAQGIAQAVTRLQDKLLALREQPLSDETRQAAVALEDEVRELGRPAAADLLLGKLRQYNELAERIEQLKRRATEDLQELYKQQQALRELNGELQTQAQQTELTVPDLSQRIDELDEGAKEPSLERARQLADSLSNDLKGLQRRFEEQGRSLLAERTAEIHAITEALRKIEQPLAVAPLPEIGNGAKPAEVAQVVIAVLEQARQAREAAEQVFRQQEEQLQSARSILRLDHREDLRPDEREAASLLLVQIEQDLAENDSNKVGRLERRWRLIEACTPLLSHFHSDERTARELRAALQERLRRQSTQNLRRFCPELADRVSGLIYGIPEQPREWKAFQAQLAEAEHLLARMERQSAHLAAEELSRAVRSLREKGGARLEVDGLLAELDRHPREALPPWPLRQKVLAAYERQRNGGHE
jgi:serine/threonine protein kinase/DNA repair exonuclease SbcCD ATPase subunit